MSQILQKLILITDTLRVLKELTQTSSDYIVLLLLLFLLLQPSADRIKRVNFNRINYLLSRNHRDARETDVIDVTAPGTRIRSSCCVFNFENPCKNGVLVLSTT